jgi:hypothetical protein
MNMATALKFDDLWSANPEVLREAFFSLDPTAQVDIPEVPPNQVPLPVRIIAREIDIIGGPNGPIGYVNPDQSHPCPDFNAIQAMVASITNNGYNAQPLSAPYQRPMDLSLRAPTCFIFRLSDNWSWRFSYKAKGATLGKNVGTDIQNYYNLRHVLDDGSQQADPFPHNRFCRLIYFIARPIAGVPNDPSKVFNHSFNLNIEMVYPDHLGLPNTIPIVIDPDVRYPGGSGVDGTP